MRFSLTIMMVWWQLSRCRHDGGGSHHNVNLMLVFMSTVTKQHQFQVQTFNVVFLTENSTWFHILASFVTLCICLFQKWIFVIITVFVMS